MPPSLSPRVPRGLFSVLFVAAHTCGVFGATVNVTSGTINEINSVVESASPSDVVLMPVGSYPVTETVVLDKPLTLQGEGGKTVVNASAINTPAVFSVVDYRNVVFERFKIENADTRKSCVLGEPLEKSSGVIDITVASAEVEGENLVIAINTGLWFNRRTLQAVKVGECTTEDPNSPLRDVTLDILTRTCAGSVNLVIPVAILEECKVGKNTTADSVFAYYQAPVTVILNEIAVQSAPGVLLATPINRNLTGQSQLSLLVREDKRYTASVATLPPYQAITGLVTDVGINTIDGIAKSNLVATLTLPPPYTLESGSQGPISFVLKNGLTEGVARVSAWQADGAKCDGVNPCAVKLRFVVTACDVSGQYELLSVPVKCAGGSNNPPACSKTGVQPATVVVSVQAGDFCNNDPPDVSAVVTADLVPKTDDTYEVTRTNASYNLNDTAYFAIPITPIDPKVTINSLRATEIKRTIEGVDCDRYGLYLANPYKITQLFVRSSTGTELRLGLPVNASFGCIPDDGMEKTNMATMQVTLFVDYTDLRDGTRRRSQTSLDGILQAGVSYHFGDLMPVVTPNLTVTGTQEPIPEFKALVLPSPVTPPTPTARPTRTPTPSPDGAATGSAVPTPTPTPSAGQTPSSGNDPSASATGTATATGTPTDTATVTGTGTGSGASANQTNGLDAGGVPGAGVEGGVGGANNTNNTTGGASAAPTASGDQTAVASQSAAATAQAGQSDNTSSQTSATQSGAAGVGGAGGGTAANGDTPTAVTQPATPTESGVGGAADAAGSANQSTQPASDSTEGPGGLAGAGTQVGGPTASGDGAATAPGGALGGVTPVTTASGGSAATAQPGDAANQPDGGAAATTQAAGGSGVAPTQPGATPGQPTVSGGTDGPTPTGTGAAGPGSGLETAGAGSGPGGAMGGTASEPAATAAAGATDAAAGVGAATGGATMPPGAAVPGQPTAGGATNGANPTGMGPGSDVDTAGAAATAAAGAGEEAGAAGPATDAATMPAGGVFPGMPTDGATPSDTGAMESGAGVVAGGATGVPGANEGSATPAATGAGETRLTGQAGTTLDATTGAGGVPTGMPAVRPAATPAATRPGPGSGQPTGTTGADNSGVDDDFMVGPGMATGPAATTGANAAGGQAETTNAAATGAVGGGAANQASSAGGPTGTQPADAAQATGTTQAPGAGTGQGAAASTAPGAVGTGSAQPSTAAASGGAGAPGQATAPAEAGAGAGGLPAGVEGTAATGPAQPGATTLAGAGGMATPTGQQPGAEEGLSPANQPPSDGMPTETASDDSQVPQELGPAPLNTATPQSEAALGTVGVVAGDTATQSAGDVASEAGQQPQATAVGGATMQAGQRPVVPGTPTTQPAGSGAPTQPGAVGGVGDMATQPTEAGATAGTQPVPVGDVKATTAAAGIVLLPGQATPSTPSAGGLSTDQPSNAVATAVDGGVAVGGQAENPLTQATAATQAATGEASAASQPTPTGATTLAAGIIPGGVATVGAGSGVAGGAGPTADVVLVTPNATAQDSLLGAPPPTASQDAGAAVAGQVPPTTPTDTGASPPTAATTVDGVPVGGLPAPTTPVAGQSAVPAEATPAGAVDSSPEPAGPLESGVGATTALAGLDGNLATAAPTVVSESTPTDAAASATATDSLDKGLPPPLPGVAGTADASGGAGLTVDVAMVTPNATAEGSVQGAPSSSPSQSANATGTVAGQRSHAIGRQQPMGWLGSAILTAVIAIVI